MMTDMDKAPIRMRRTRVGLEPSTRLAADLISKYDLGSEVEIKIKQRRSSEQNAAYWTMLERVVEATGGAFPTSEALHKALKLDLGYTTPIKKLSGEIIFVPDSTAFAKMDAPAFREFFAKAEALIAERFGIDVQELRQGSDPSQLGRAAA